MWVPMSRYGVPIGSLCVPVCVYRVYLGAAVDLYRVRIESYGYLEVAIGHL